MLLAILTYNTVATTQRHKRTVATHYKSGMNTSNGRALLAFSKIRQRLAVPWVIPCLATVFRDMNRGSVIAARTCIAQLIHPSATVANRTRNHLMTLGMFGFDNTRSAP